MGVSQPWGCPGPNRGRWISENGHGAGTKRTAHWLTSLRGDPGHGAKATQFFPKPGSPGDTVLRARSHHRHPHVPHTLLGLEPYGKEEVTGLGSCFAVHQRSNHLP